MTNKPEQGTEIPLLRKELAATNERLEALVVALADVRREWLAALPGGARAGRRPPRAGGKFPWRARRATEAQEEVARLKRERDSWDDAHAAVCAQLETVVSERNALRNSIAKLKSERNHTEERSARRNQPPDAISERIAKLERAVNEAKRLLTYPYCGTNSEFSRHRDAWLKEHGT